MAELLNSSIEVYEYLSLNSEIRGVLAIMSERSAPHQHKIVSSDDTNHREGTFSVLLHPSRLELNPPSPK